MFENLSRELLEKAQKAKTKEEAFAILREGGVVLTEEDLKNISGGEGDEGICWTHRVPCSELACFLDKSCIADCACVGDYIS